MFILTSRLVFNRRLIEWLTGRLKKKKPAVFNRSVSRLLSHSITMETGASQRVSRSPKCARCRNHGFVVALKGHAGRCRFSQCGCWKCALITERTRIMARHRGIRKGQRADEHERGAGETGNGIGASSDANGDPMSGVVRSPARGADTEDRTYTELEAPEPAWAPNTDPETPHKSPDRCRGAEESAVSAGK